MHFENNEGSLDSAGDVIKKDSAASEAVWIDDVLRTCSALLFIKPAVIIICKTAFSSVNANGPESFEKGYHLKMIWLFQNPFAT